MTSNGPGHATWLCLAAAATYTACGFYDASNEVVVVAAAVVCLFGWLVVCLFVWLIVCLFVCLVGWLFVCLFG